MDGIILLILGIVIIGIGILYLENPHAFARYVKLHDALQGLQSKITLDTIQGPKIMGVVMIAFGIVIGIIGFLIIR